MVTKEKGESLEKLAVYLSLLIPACIPMRNVQDEQNTSEIDLVVRDYAPQSNLMVDLFGRHFLVECKNREKRVSSRDVGYFLNKMRMMHTTFGIIFARQGITGTKEDRAAKELTKHAFHEDRSVCIVISVAELTRLEAGDTTFRQLLLQLYEEFRFGRPKQPQE